MTKKTGENKETALVVVEQPVEEKTPDPLPPPVYPEIKNKSFHVLKRAGLENIPDSDKLFFLITWEGLFLNKNTALGRALVKQKNWPEWLPKLGTSKGHFEWTAPIIPATVTRQIVGFFERIYDKRKTEAEVILL